MAEPSQDWEALLVRIRTGGQAALAELFTQNRSRLRRMVDARLDRRVARRVDPSDVLQEAFLDASRQLGGYLADARMPPFLWLRLLTGRRLMAIHRRHLSAQMRDVTQETHLRGDWVPGADAESLSCYLAAGLTSPSHAVARLELQSRLQELLCGLAPLDREILSLRHFEELSNDEASEELGISKFAASKRYVRALERLRKALAQVPGLLEE